MSHKMEHKRLYTNGFLRLNQVLKLIPVCKATWWNGCKTGRFPKPYKLGPRTTAWRMNDIYACMEGFQSTHEEK
jgi:prophage regulatory protein